VKSIDVISPVYNEAENLPELVSQLIQVFDSQSQYEWRLILVENGSTDQSWNIIKDLAKSDRRVTSIRLSRNFRMDGGLTAGLDYATADAVIFMASDLQDSPKAIPLFLEKWEEGFENVYAYVSKREGTSLLRKINSQLFYWIANLITGNKIPKNVSDFRLLSRTAYESLREMREANRFMRGLVGWMGFNSIGVDIPRPPRFAGQSKAYTSIVVGMAIRAILAHSYVPLRMISAVGVTLSLGSVITLIATTFLFLFKGVPFPGFGTLLSVVLLLFGIVFLILGIMSEYLALIYEEVKKRPNFIVKDSIGFN
jgi:glycosyltransferase involved in cell wall biosynthesis